MKNSVKTVRPQIRLLKGKATNCKYKIAKIKTNLMFDTFERQKENPEGEKRKDG